MSDEIERDAGTADEAKADVEAHRYVTEEPGEDQGEGEKIGRASCRERVCSTV